MMKYWLFSALMLFAAMPVQAADTAQNDEVTAAQIEKILSGNDVSALDALIAKDIDVNMRDENGNTLLLYALNNNDDLMMAKQLIIAGADVNAPSSETGVTPLILATSMADTLQEQTQKIYNSEQVDFSEQELKRFMLSQMTKAYEILQILIDAGADINQETPYGTPLMNAAKNEWNEPIIKKLLENAAKVNQKDRLGRTALFYAAAFNCNKNISLLMAAGGDLTVKDIDGKAYTEAKPKDFLVR